MGEMMHLCGLKHLGLSSGFTGNCQHLQIIKRSKDISCHREWSPLSPHRLPWAVELLGQNPGP